MAKHVIAPADVAVEPWRNGSGSRRMLLHSPDWRISLAEIEGHMTFSRFPGLDRLLIPLTEPGVILRISGSAHHVAPREALRFRGEDSVVGEACGDRATVVNVMSTRGAVDVIHSIERGDVDVGTTSAVVVLAGKVAIDRRALRPGTVILPGALARTQFAQSSITLRLSLRPVKELASGDPQRDSDLVAAGTVRSDQARHRR